MIKLRDGEIRFYLGRLCYEHHELGSDIQYSNGYGKEFHLAAGYDSISIQVSYLRESFESWHNVIGEVKKRVTKWIGSVIAEGMPSFWIATGDVYPDSKWQFFVHKMFNILNMVYLLISDFLEYNGLALIRLI